MQDKSFRYRLFNCGVITNVLKYFDEEQLLQLRKVSLNFADTVIPKQFSHFKVELPNDGEQEAEDYDALFMSKIKNARKLEIRNICGTEDHLKRLIQIGQNQVGQVEYLFLEIDDDETT